MLLTATAALLAFNAHPISVPHSPAVSRVATRVGTIVAQDVDTSSRPTTSDDDQGSGVDLPISWAVTPSGFRYLDDVVGYGGLPSTKNHDVVQLHYTVSLLSTGTTLGSSRDAQPLTMALAKHEVPIWDEALVGMRVGGKRRMLVPPGAIPSIQKDKVPGESRTLRFDFELVRVIDKRTPMGMLATWLPPQKRSATMRTWFTTLWALSFIPYFLPQSMQPSFYHDGMPPEEIRQRQLDREQARFLGTSRSTIENLDLIFPSESL